MSGASAGSRRALATCPLPPGMTGNAARRMPAGAARVRDRRGKGGREGERRQGRKGVPAAFPTSKGKRGRKRVASARWGGDRRYLAGRAAGAPGTHRARVASLPFLSFAFPLRVPFPSLPFPSRCEMAGDGQGWAGAAQGAERRCTDGRPRSMRSALQRPLRQRLHLPPAAGRGFLSAAGPSALQLWAPLEQGDSELLQRGQQRLRR